MNVLAIRQDNNGDVLLAGPALRAIATHASHLTLLCGPSGKAAAELLPSVDAVLCSEAGWIEANPSAFDRADIDALVTDIARRNIERAVIFTSFHQSPLPIALVLRMAGVRNIVGLSEDYAGNLLDVRHRGISDDLHEVERALSIAEAAGFPPSPEDDSRLAMNAASESPVSWLRPYIVVHPGATVPARAWEPEANRALVEALSAAGNSVVVTGGQGERALCEFVAAGRAINLAGQTDFATLGRVIADASAIVVGNTGAAHVAAAMGTPTVSIFPPTIPVARFRPWMVDSVIFGNQNIACRYCRARECPRRDHACVRDIEVAEVLGAIAAIRRPAAIPV
jgi:ADP-heptose:LPS heptosyltransferase